MRVCACVCLHTRACAVFGVRGHFGTVVHAFVNLNSVATGVKDEGTEALSELHSNALRLCAGQKQVSKPSEYKSSYN